MKKMQLISICVLIITLLLIGINNYIFHLPDWIIRFNGIIMLVGILMVSYSTVKLYH